MKPSKATVEALDQMARALTPKQRRFAEALAADPERNQTKAALAAGSPNEKQAAITGARWIRLSKVRSYIDALTSEGQKLAKARVGQVVMTAAEVQERLSKQARSDIGVHLKIHEDGHYTVELDPDHTDIVRAIKVRQGADRDGMPWSETELKVADPNVPLQALARIYGLDKSDRPDQPGARTLNINVLLGRLDDGELRNLKTLLARAQELGAGSAA